MAAIAVIGSRRYPFLSDVAALVERIAQDDPSNVVVSGGAEGVDKTAETVAYACGIRAISFRVVELAMESFGVQEWHIGPEGYVRIMVEQPTWLNFNSALQFRNSIIVERADRVVAFWDGISHGTGLARDFAHAYKRPMRTYGVGEDDRCILS